MKEDYPIINSKIKSITFEITKNVFNTSGNEITQDRDTPSVDILFTYLDISSHIGWQHSSRAATGRSETP